MMVRALTNEIMILSLKSHFISTRCREGSLGVGFCTMRQSCYTPLDRTFFRLILKFSMLLNIVHVARKVDLSSYAQPYPCICTYINPADDLLSTIVEMLHNACHLMNSSDLRHIFRVQNETH